MIATDAAVIPALVEEIRAFCRRSGSPERAQRYAGYFKEGYDAYGVPQEVFEAELRRLTDAHRSLGLAGFLALGDALLRDGKYEEASFAISFPVAFRDACDAAAFERFGVWLGDGIRNWAHTDVLCTRLLGPMLASGVVGLANLAPWTAATSKWQRRAVPVALISLLKSTADVVSLLDLVRPLMTDPEEKVQQGTGWFLREAWKQHREPVEAFLLEWKDTAPRRIYQYATEKMSADEKARFRAARRRA